jgi:hypothetical protein
LNRHAAIASNLIFIAITFGAIAPTPAVAQNHPPAENLPDSDAPQLHLSSNASTYQQGELIQLTLSFTSKIPNRYRLNLASYDRGGRMFYEGFDVHPVDGTKDPLLVYFLSRFGLFLGGLTNFEFLSKKPIVIPLDLNEWVRFDKPGKYRITVQSTRVNDTTIGDKEYGTPVEIESNTIELQILAPDPAWQQAQLREILAKLGHPPSARWASMPVPTSIAMRRLRYLGTADAARELAQHISDEQSGISALCLFGLIGSPNRTVGLEELRKLLVDPDFPVRGVFLIALSILPLDPDESAENLRKQSEANMKAAQSALINTLPMKRGRALDESLETAMQGAGPKAATELKDKFVAQLIESFDQLPVEQQVDWIGENWAKVKDPKWLPTLRAIAARYTDFAPPHNRTEAYYPLHLTGTALMRWYELDPEGARGAVIAEITRPKPRYGANILGLLPDKTLPAQQQAIASHFLSAPDYETEGYLASLLDRYADAAVLPIVLDKIKRKIQHQPWECIPETYSLSYVEKVDPTTGMLLREQLKDSPCLNGAPRTD